MKVVAFLGVDVPHCNAAGIALIEKFEGCLYEAYADPVGVWTIGYGHTGTDVHPGEIITQAEAEALLRSDIHEAEAAVAGAVEVVLTPNQFSALVAFTFNVGGAAFRNSTLCHLVNQDDFAGAAEQFTRWVHGDNDEVLLGLVRRRVAEKALFLTP